MLRDTDKPKLGTPVISDFGAFMAIRYYGDRYSYERSNLVFLSVRDGTLWKRPDWAHAHIYGILDP